jgi:serine/threonine-protein kinase
MQEVDSSVNALLEPIVQRCLAKDPDERWQSVRDLLVALRWIAAGSLRVGAPVPVRQTPRLARVALGLGLLFAGMTAGLIVSALLNSTTALPPLTRWDVALPAERSFDAELFPSLAVSPDGRHIVFRAQSKGTSQLFIRGLSEFEARPIDRSEGGHTPFFSPDGQWIGFLANGRVYRLPVGGGAPSIVCEAPSLSPGSPGAAWGPDNTIVFAAGAAGLMQVPAAGGKPMPLTTPNLQRGEVTHIGPQFLPGGDELLFMVRTAEDGWKIAILSMKTRQWDWLPPIGEVAGVTYVGSGHLVYAQAESLYAVPVDLSRRAFTGPPVPLLDDVYTKVVSDAIVAQFSVSESGVLSYVSGHAPEWELVRVNAAGDRQPLGNLRRSFRYPRVSPDGSRIAVTVEEERADIYLVDAVRGNLRKLTTTGTNMLPVWTTDGERVVYASRRLGSKGYDIYSSPVDANTDATLLFSREGSQIPSGWSPRDDKLAFYELGNETARDIWVWSVDGNAQKVLASSANERGPAFSPDGSWLAYVSNESGRDEVYVRPYLGSGSGEVVSSGGGTEPVWSPNGGELLYWNNDQLLAVTIRTGPELKVSAPRVVLQGAFVRSPPETGQPNYGVFPDGKSFVMVRTLDTAAAHLHVVQNWFAQLRVR